MNVLAEKKQLDAALDEYRRRLDTIPDERFDQTPPNGGWSYAEVYNHIMQADLGASIAMQKCTQGTLRHDGKKPNLLGRFMLLLGMFPPVKLKVPAGVEARIPARKIDKEEARNLIVKVRKRITDLMPLLEEASPNCTIQHPAMGHFNAPQWLKFIRVHTQHHLKQLDRIDKAW